MTAPVRARLLLRLGDDERLDDVLGAELLARFFGFILGRITTDENAKPLSLTFEIRRPQVRLESERFHRVDLIARFLQRRIRPDLQRETPVRSLAIRSRDIRERQRL